MIAALTGGVVSSAVNVPAISAEDMEVLGPFVPLCRALGQGLWEVRSGLTQGRIARVLFCIQGGRMVLLHAFIKKTQKTPEAELALAVKRKKEIT